MARAGPVLQQRQEENDLPSRPVSTAREQEAASALLTRDPRAPRSRGQLSGWPQSPFACEGPDTARLSPT